MKPTKGTIIRTVMILLVVLNLILKSLGINTLTFSENGVASVIEALIEIGAVISAWWYNNSFTENAKKADEFFKELKEAENV